MASRVPGSGNFGSPRKCDTRRNITRKDHAEDQSPEWRPRCPPRP